MQFTPSLSTVCPEGAQKNFPLQRIDKCNCEDNTSISRKFHGDILRLKIKVELNCARIEVLDFLDNNRIVESGRLGFECSSPCDFNDHNRQQR